jgi:putative endonuclease
MPSGKSGHVAFGADAEAIVARWYEQAGYRVIARNWRTREGELDVIAALGSLVVFCEVKARKGLGFGAPMEAVTVAKQRKIRALAAQWLAASDVHPRDLRFDVASVLWAPGHEPVIDVIEAAF